MTAEEFLRLKILLKNPSEYQRLKKKIAADTDEEFGKALDRVRQEVLAEMKQEFFAQVDEINS